MDKMIIKCLFIEDWISIVDLLCTLYIEMEAFDRKGAVDAFINNDPIFVDKLFLSWTRLTVVIGQKPGLDTTIWIETFNASTTA